MLFWMRPLERLLMFGAFLDFDLNLDVYELKHGWVLTVPGFLMVLALLRFFSKGQRCFKHRLVQFGKESKDTNTDVSPSQCQEESQWR